MGCMLRNCELRETVSVWDESVIGYDGKVFMGFNFIPSTKVG